MRRVQYQECANPSCSRRLYAGGQNKFGACHACMEIIGVVEWLLRSGVLSVADKGKADAMGIWYPGKEVRRA